MTEQKNVAASVRQRLLDRAREDRRPFNELLQYYAMERFLYRLSRSDHGERFILKGALLLRVWNSPMQRPTMDIDLLGKVSSQPADIIQVFREILTVEVAADGLVFDPESFRADRITEDAEYDGVRVRFDARLGTAKVFMQVDIGFGDVVYPAPAPAELPTTLGDPPPRLLCYGRESVIAEKLEAMARHGELNSRLKDFYDIWLLSRQYAFEREILVESVRRTFDQREVPPRRSLTAFTSRFVEAKQAQWAAFLLRARIEGAPERFRDVVEDIEDFLGPVLEILESSVEERDGHWVVGKGWE